MTKKGFSIVLVIIAIMLMVIVGGAILLTVGGDSPMDSTKEVAFKSDIVMYNDELFDYIKSMQEIYGEEYDSKLLNVTKSVATYNNEPIEGINGISDIIKSIKEDDSKNYAIVSGSLVYVGTDSTKMQWANNTGIINTKSTAPLLAKGMTPVKYEQGEWIDTKASDKDWYDYANKQWANARTEDGSMWVWIPRYAYKIENSHSDSEQQISIKFLQGTENVVETGYIVHPAFKYGKTELTGIWVAKYEASGTTNNISIKPNEQAINNVTISEAFNACKNIESINGVKYGWGASGAGIDTHLMKNTEWGAVAYLANSIYGANAKLNSNLTNYTGGGISDAYIDNTSQSTTSNVYGVYDMSGGSSEYTSAYVYFENNDETNDNEEENKTNKNLKNGNAIVEADEKNKQIYLSDMNIQAKIYSACISSYGDALYETSNGVSGDYAWYDSYISMPYEDEPFFTRGGSYNKTDKTGLFSVVPSDGKESSYIGFRPVLLVGLAL